MTKKDFNSFSVDGSTYRANVRYSGEQIEKLPPGMYVPRFNSQTGDFWLEKMELTTDHIIDLPSPEYSRVTKEIQQFLQPETKTKFLDKGFMYKRSCLLYGEPGTGKTVITNRITRDVINSGGVVIWGDADLALIKHTFKILNNIQPDDLTMVVFEEFDAIVKRYESELLTLLDGQVQKNNIIYLATTNYLDRIPKRIYRPGRFSSVIEVKYPIAEARDLYFKIKLGSQSNHDQLVAYTEGLSIDELKEIVQACYIFDYPIKQEVTRLLETRGAKPVFESDATQFTSSLMQNVFAKFYEDRPKESEEIPKAGYPDEESEEV